MGHGKETPRQKMIGLMYLFLTAMLALNVSKSVLDSFILVSDGLEKTIDNFKSKNDKIYNEFDKSYMMNQAKVGPWKEKADIVRKESESLFALLEKHKVDLAIYAEGPETPAVVDNKFVTDKLSQKDNIDKGGEYFIGLKHGEALKESIDKYKETLLKIVPPENEELVHTIKSTLDTEVHKKKGKEKHGGHGDEAETWQSMMFEHIPLIADFVMLSKLQTDIKNMETDVVNYLFNQISANDYKVNKIQAMVMANSNYVMTGGEYKAEVFIAAYDSTQDPEIYIGEFKSLGDGRYEIPEDAQKLEVKNGKGIYQQPARGVGQKKWGGLIKLKNPDGGESYYPFSSEYQVAQSNIVVSPTKMNVFYYGIKNPVAVSVPGIPSSDIIPRIAGGASIKKARKGYVVTPTKRSGKVKVQVYAKIDGKQKLMGSMDFRIKTVPAPIAKVMGRASGTISKALLSNAPGIYAELEDFLFDLKFTVTKFTLVSQNGIYVKEYTIKGSKFTREIKDVIKRAKRGSRITIENIEAKGEDGRTRQLSPIVLKLK
jgi:gliding motility-associated protein GldM